MSDDTEHRELLALGHALEERLSRRTADDAALLAARRRALQSIASNEDRARPRADNWFPAAAVASIAALSVALVFQFNLKPQNGGPIPSEHVVEADGPWQENPDMLQNMDFTLWLDMAEPEDAG